MKLIPVTPKLEFLCRGEVLAGPPIKTGKLDFGEMCMVPLLGGHFEGKITGDVLPGGADTQWLKPDGTVAHIDARYMIKTTDGAIIYIHNPGLRVIKPDIIDRIWRGEDVDPVLYYFRTTPEIETGSPKYAWLNNVVCVCSGARSAKGAILDFYTVS
jgi:hypothetical protein